MEDQARELAGLAARFARHTQPHADSLPARVRELLAATGLGMRHVHTMIPLAIDGPMVVGQLADRLALAPATTSQLVNELHRAGLVVREPDDADRRRILVSIRDDVRPAFAALAARRLQPFREALSRMSARERADFVQGWRLLVEVHETTRPA